ncbi:MAG: 16S rRNA (guanine(966)-N(2))-methyltransferase RsmD [Alphaproteobacteria bacterium]|nr:16S rRNA (guanine(966)-N(2))-methyltransferase RsmD [Alphaproteobacteria bacterium]
MRIVAGLKRGKILNTPTDDKTRPTSDRAREALFNILNAILLKEKKQWKDITFLDVFAGTGAVGLEALSRGAKESLFIENHPPALACLKSNASDFENAHIMMCDATCPPYTTRPMNIIFMDAPYREELWEKALMALSNKCWIDEKTLVIVEIEKKEENILPAGFKLLDDRIYGRNRLLFCKKAPISKNC